MAMFGNLFGAAGSASGKTPEQGSGGYAGAATAEAPKKGSDWALHLGPLSIGSQGVDLKPQLKVGVDAKNLKAEFGLGDVRDGVRLAAKAETKVEAKCEGHSVKQLNDRIHCETPGFREAMVIAKKALSKGGDGVKQIAKVLGVDKAALEKVLAEDPNTAEIPGDAPLMSLRVKAALGIGVAGEVKLGWKDTKGYNMVGVGGEAAAGVNVGCNIFAGKHSTGASVKVILGMGNFEFEYVLPVDQKLFKPPAPKVEAVESVDLLG